MKVAHVNVSDVGGGAESVATTLHLGLREHGHESTLYVANKQSDIDGVEEIPYQRGIPGFRRLHYQLESFTGWQNIFDPSFRALKDVVEKDTDIIHFHNLWSAGVNRFSELRSLPALTQIAPGVLTEHQTWSMTGHCAHFGDCERWRNGCGKCPDLDTPPAIKRDGTRNNFRRKQKYFGLSDLVFVGVSHWVTDMASRSPIWRGARRETVWNGVDTNVFFPVSRKRKLELRAKYSIPGDRFALLITGQTLQGYANGSAPFGIEVAKTLQDDSVVFVLVGRSAHSVAEKLGHRAIPISHRSTPKQMAECYQACDANLSASRIEAFGCIPAESQACGTPVVATKVGGLVDVVKENVGGHLVCYGDRDALRARLQQLIDSPDQCARLARLGAKDIRERLSQERMVQAYLDVYGSIIDR